MNAVFAAAAPLPHGNAFTNANKALDHFMAHGPRARAVTPPRLHSGQRLPGELIARRRRTPAPRPDARARLSERLKHPTMKIPPESPPSALSYKLPEGQTVRSASAPPSSATPSSCASRLGEGLTGYGGAHPGCPGAVTALVNHTLNPLLAGMDPCNVVGVWARVNRMQLSSHGLGAGAALALSGIDTRCGTSAAGPRTCRCTACSAAA